MVDFIHASIAATDKTWRLVGAEELLLRIRSCLPKHLHSSSLRIVARRRRFAITGSDAPPSSAVCDIKHQAIVRMAAISAGVCLVEAIPTKKKKTKKPKKTEQAPVDVVIKATTIM
jgi:hypothetical protein